MEKKNFSTEFLKFKNLLNVKLKLNENINI